VALLVALLAGGCGGPAPPPATPAPSPPEPVAGGAATGASAAPAAPAPGPAVSAGTPGGLALLGQTVPVGTSQRLIWEGGGTFDGGSAEGIPVFIVNGNAPGPLVCLTAAIHGDELNGIEMVRRIMQDLDPARLSGGVVGIPIVNLQGFRRGSRYLPDRRDLNRSFPGSAGGSLAARLAHIFLSEIVSRADVGIDLHSAAIHRTNFPQIRIAPGDARIKHLAEAFGAPVILTSKLREGSLRQVARGLGVGMLLYEAGEGLRFDEFAARVGVAGIQRVMRSLGMTAARGPAAPRAAPLHALSSYWLRAPAGGLLRPFRSTGEQVRAGDVLGIISDPFGEVETDVLAEDPGLIVGRTNLPVVNEGDGLFHIARLEVGREAARALDAIAQQIEGESLFDEDEII
jgi:predicted deacylase